MLKVALIVAAVFIHKPAFRPIGGAKTYYLRDAQAGTTQHMQLQDGGPAPATARISTGWVVGNVASGNYARQDAQTERASTAHTSTVQPSGGPDNILGDCFVTTSALSGNFASANWTLSFEVQGESRATSTHDGNLRIRMWKSQFQSGASATEIGTVQETSAYANLANTASQAITVTFNPGAINFTGEFLFIQIAHEITGSGNNAGSDTHLCVGTNNKIVTSTFTP